MVLMIGIFLPVDSMVRKILIVDHVDFLFLFYLGHGAYFADNPNKSHSYTSPDPTTTTRVMFYNKVSLGNPHVINATDSSLVCAPLGFHSIIGKHNSLTEYIVYRYGQALPYLKIVYRGN